MATGNVVFSGPEGRIAAERVEFNVTDGTGTFYQASGIMSLGATVDRVQFGNQDPDVYFYGDMVEKVSQRSYRLTRGGFTTCVQPTPRWEVTSDSVVINLNDYAIARNMLLRVKGVPLMYLPIIYYPIKDEDRATGFLLPTYGSSTLRGQAISNAFFWAIGRSQDATFFHDWFTTDRPGRRRRIPVRRRGRPRTGTSGFTTSTSTRRSSRRRVRPRSCRRRRPTRSRAPATRRWAPRFASISASTTPRT